MRYPLLYQINTRAHLRDLSPLGQPAARLDQISDATLEDLHRKGFDWAWFLGVWQTGEAGRHISRTNREFVEACRRALPDLTEEDIQGSPFAISQYTVHADFGGDTALASLRERMRRQDLNLLLDFVPNHVAPDHPWIQEHPEYFIHGSEADLAREPQNYTRIQSGNRSFILAHGRDPYFPGWSDTLQLNYFHTGLRAAMRQELQMIAERCDGVRCDMAMLVLPDIFERTWGERARPFDGTAPVKEAFWPQAISEVRAQHPGFLFIAEVYWDLEYRLQQEGFDFTYDKRLYDRLHAGNARAVREHLMAAPDFQDHSLRFLENHDEPRAADVFPTGLHQAAAVITYFVPGLRFFHEGQLQGWLVHLPMHVGRRPVEPVDTELESFYAQILLELRRPEVHQGRWRLRTCKPAWDGNPTWNQFIAFSWQMEGRPPILAAVNFGPTQAQCYVQDLGDLPLQGVISLSDQFSSLRYQRDMDQLRTQGLYLDLPPFGYNFFEMTDRRSSAMDRRRMAPVRPQLVGV